MNEHRKFLADRLLSEGQPITYGTLSTSLDVHVNRAKGMLFDFHQYQNGLHGNPVYATYLVCGVIAASGATPEDEEANGSYQLPEGLAHAVHTKKLTLVGEEKLRDVLGHYKSVTSIHIYGLSPSTMKDFWFCKDSVLTECGPASDDRKQSGGSEKHGAVRNPHARWQDRKSQFASFSSSHFQPSKLETEQTVCDPKRTSEQLPHPKQQHTAQRKEVISRLSTSDRAAPNSILTSFARATANVRVKPKAQAKQEDTPAMALSDDGEADDFHMLPSNSDSALPSNGKSRKDREDALRRMMEEEDDQEEEEEEEEEEHGGPDKSEDDLDMEDIPVPEETLKTEADPENNPAVQTRKEPSEIISSTGDGRRRGKRQVLKKKRIVDDQGYMVTIQEPGWESFSEDEIIQPPTKKPAPATTQPSSSAKTKKTPAKGSQGSIMSFFAKK